MIVNFSIQNFGSIKNRQTVSFEADESTHLEDAYVMDAGGTRLLKLALIYGPNASGKTTILKALDFLRELVLEPADKKTDELDFEPFLFDRETPEQHSTLSLEFLQEGIKYFYEVEFTKKAIVREELFFFNPDKANLYKRTTHMANQFTEIAFGSKIKIDKAFEKVLEANTLWNNTVLGGYLKTNIDFKELKLAVEWFKARLKPLVRTDTNLEQYVTAGINEGEINKEEVIAILKKADFQISDIVIQEKESDPDKVLIDLLLNRSRETAGERLLPREGKRFTSLRPELEHTVNENRFSLPFELESHGTKRFYGFAGLLAQLIKQPVILPVDELEASLHPELYIHFLLSFLLNSNQSQVIATTHHREILNNKDIFRNDAIWFTDKDRESATEIYSLADFDSSVIRDSTNVLNAYKSGKLGATPNPGDHYIDLKN